LAVAPSTLIPAGHCGFERQRRRRDAVIAALSL
jgi:hypothetical protein